MKGGRSSQYRKVRLKDPSGVMISAVMLHVKTRHYDGRAKDVRICYDEEKFDLSAMQTGKGTPEFLTVWMAERDQRPDVEAARAALEAEKARLVGELDLIEQAKIDREAGRPLSRESLGVIARLIAEREAMVEGLQMVVLLSDPQVNFVVSATNVSDKLTAAMLRTVLDPANGRAELEEKK